uniref:F-box domain-containing protein n=1 Tax=Triticum aestivum TaxID=4565 RepID=A0A080YU15_WHEAT|nr:unnamed protein product [Triticum aestivum]
MSTCKKARAEATSVVSPDRLSCLPREIKGEILSHLNIEEAIRTSTLSSIWRDAWTDTPKIFLRDGNFPRTKFVMLVEMVLSLHKGTIEKFDISGEGSYHDEFARWMLMLSRRSPKSVIINLNSWPRYRIPSCLFSVADLKSLRLENCIISLPREFEGFKSLTYLSLNIFSSTDRDIQYLVSFCPVLTNLRLSSFEGIDCLNIQAPKLKYLRVNGDFVYIKLDVPNLKWAILSLRHEVKAYQSVPIVHDKESYLKQSLGSLSDIETLSVSGFFLKSYPLGLSDQDQVSITVQVQMDHLITASVEDFGGLDYEINFVAKLLSWAPALEKLNIKWNGETDCGRVLAKLLALPRVSPRAKVTVTF